MTIVENKNQGSSSIFDQQHKKPDAVKKQPQLKMLTEDLQESLDREVLSRARYKSTINSSFLKRLSHQHPHVILCFIKLATTYKQEYYNKATLQELIQKFTVLMNLFERVTVAMPNIDKTTPCYDQEGKEWVDSLITTLSTCANVNDQIGLIQNLLTAKQLEQAVERKYGCLHYSQFKEIPSDHPEWGTLSADKLTAVMMRSLARSKNRLPMGEYASLGQLLQSPPYHEEFDETERKRILQNVKACTTHDAAQGTVYAYVQWCCRVKQTLGDEVFDLLTTPTCYEGKKLSIKDVNSMMQCLLEIDDAVDEVMHQLENFSEGVFSFEELNGQLNLKKIELYQRKFPEKDIKDVVAAFSDTKLGGVDVAMPKEEVGVLLTQYLKIESYGKDLKSESLDGLVAIVQKIQKRSAGKVFSADDQLLLLAVGREAIRKKFGIYPYNTQVMATLGLVNHPDKLKGRIARMLTGEGKSTVITMLSFFLACQGKTIDIISSARYLARRDQVKYKDFFQAFGITASHICTDSPTKQHFDAQIIYGTNYDFEFSILGDGLRGEPMRMWHVEGKEVERQADSVIVDESDNLFLDSAMNSARIAVPGSDEHTWVYEPILSFVKSNKAAIEHALVKDEKHTQLGIIAGTLVQQLNNLQKRRFREEIKAIHQDTFIKWIESAHEALYVHKEEEDYVIKPQEKMTAKGKVVQDEIVIVDKNNTGRLQLKSRWQNGLHQFLESKHNLPIQAESMMPASLCHPVFFEYYPLIFGLTGTIGTVTERVELEKVYTIDSFDVPPHKKNNREMLDPQFSLSKDLYFKALISEAKEMVSQGRPILILLESIRDTLDLSKHLKQENLFHQVLNERQAESEDYIIAKAGDPGMITVATNNAGRGTDIILHPDSLDNGGLHAVMGFYPTNDRVERQGFGRAGRQGQPGSCRMIIGSHDTAVQQLMRSDPLFMVMMLSSPETIFSKIKEAREQRIQSLSHHRQERSEVEKVNHKYLKFFFKDLKRWHAETDESLIKELAKKLAIAVRTEEVIQQPAQSSELHKIFQHICQTVGNDSHTEKLASQLIAAIKETVADSISYNWSKLFYNNLDELYQSIKRSKSDTEEIVTEYKKQIKGVYAQFEVFREEFLLSGSDGLYAATRNITGLDLIKDYKDIAPEPVIVVELDKPDMKKIPHKDKKYVEFATSGEYHNLTFTEKGKTWSIIIKHGLKKCFKKYFDEDKDFLIECNKTLTVDGYKLIHFALDHKQEDLALELLELPECDVNCIYKGGIRPLALAAKYGLSKAFHKILSMPGVNPLDIDHSRTTVLMYAVTSDSLGIVKTLCAREDIKNNINAVDRCGYIALDQVFFPKTNRLAIFSEIFKIPGNDVNGKTQGRKGRSTLNGGLNCPYSYEKNEPIIDALLKMPGIDVNHVDGNGMNIVMNAAYQGNYKLVAKLRADGRVNVNVKDNRGGNTALIWAARFQITKALLEILKFKDVDTTAKYCGVTALTRCLQDNYLVGATAILTYKGYNVTIAGEESIRRVLNLAIEKGDIQTKREILDSKVITYTEPNPKPKPKLAFRLPTGRILPPAKTDNGGGCVVM